MIPNLLSQFPRVKIQFDQWFALGVHIVSMFDLGQLEKLPIFIQALVLCTHISWIETIYSCSSSKFFSDYSLEFQTSILHSQNGWKSTIKEKRFE